MSGGYVGIGEHSLLILLSTWEQLGKNLNYILGNSVFS